MHSAHWEYILAYHFNPSSKVRADVWIRKKWGNAVERQCQFLLLITCYSLIRLYKWLHLVKISSVASSFQNSQFKEKNTKKWQKSKVLYQTCCARCWWSVPSVNLSRSNLKRLTSTNWASNRSKTIFSLIISIFQLKTMPSVLQS